LTVTPDPYPPDVHFPLGRTLAVVALLTAGCSSGGSGSAAPSTSITTASGFVVDSSTTTSPSHLRPPAAVPGALADPQPPLSQLCSPGYTKTVRPPAAYTDDLKRRQLVQFGYADRDPSHYEEDHLVPLELAGAPREERNLWPQPWPEARQKDREENDLHVGVCTHRMSLGDAQRRILADWGPTG
jgi:hypothetical protein